MLVAKKKERLAKAKGGAEEKDEEEESKENYFALHHNQFLLDFRKDEIVQYVERVTSYTHIHYTLCHLVTRLTVVWLIKWLHNDNK
jgi:hypothetical protein